MRRCWPIFIGAGSNTGLGASTEALQPFRRENGRMHMRWSDHFVEQRVVRRVVVLTALLDLVCFVLGFVFEVHLRAVGRSDLGSVPEGLLGLSMVATTWVVGATLARGRPEHPVGWLFLALGSSIAVAAPLDLYATQGVLVAAEPWPAASFVAVAASLVFVPWLVLIALILHLTPTGMPLQRGFAFMMRATVVAGVAAMGFGILANRRLDPPLDQVSNPLAAGSMADSFRVAASLAVAVVGIGVLAAAASLALRFRRAVGIERLQLRWLSIIASPVAILMLAAFVPGHTRLDYSPLVPTAGIVLLLAVATGLAVHRYRLYDVERILSRTLTYSVLSALIVGVFLAVGVLAGAVFGRYEEGTRVSAAIATLCAVGIAEPGRRRLQNMLDRRFDRRRYGALSVVRRYLDAPGPVADIQAVLREALGDDSLEISYPLLADGSGSTQWVTASGLAATEAPMSVDVLRGERLVARVTYSQMVIGPEVASAVYRAAASELDNAGLRALVALQLVEVQQSRARLAAGQYEERCRIERNLHDGAQQRLLALALQLQAASVNGNEQRMKDAIDVGIKEVRCAIVDLRSLANGLRPTVLSDGGLRGALEDLADRNALHVTMDSCLDGLAPDLEETAWFIICEAVANAQKHSAADTIDITAHRHDGVFEVAVFDNGCGGADADGHGLRGLRDRAEAVGGSLVVRRAAAGGTVVEAVLPCG